MRWYLLLISLLLFSCGKDVGEVCMAQTECRKGLECSGFTGRCVDTCAKHCKSIGQCRFCGLDRGLCEAVSDSDCQASNLCKGIECVEYEGVCHQVGKSEAFCRSSRLCKAAGHCSYYDGMCIAASYQDCRQSLLCKEYGGCKAIRGACRR